jgi:predicted RecA/RadA family phage recombinase
MAKNYSSDGSTVNFVAPTGGAVAGQPCVLVQLVVMPLGSGPKGTPLVGVTNGAWNIPTAPGLKQGAKVSVLAGALVADGTTDSVPFGKLLADESGGYAEALLVQ